MAVRGSERVGVNRYRGLDGVLSECARGPAAPLTDGDPDTNRQKTSGPGPPRAGPDRPRGRASLVPRFTSIQRPCRCPTTTRLGTPTASADWLLARIELLHDPRVGKSTTRGARSFFHCWAREAQMNLLPKGVWIDRARHNLTSTLLCPVGPL